METKVIIADDHSIVRMGLSSLIKQFNVQVVDEVDHLPKYKKGNGVGYQIIRNVVKLMKAKLEIDSIENKGTTVSIFFVS